MSQAQPPIPPGLFETLERQIALSEQLLTVLNNEMQVLTRIDLPTLVSLTRKKESLLKRLQLLDEALQEMATALGHDSSSEPVRLKTIIARTEPETAARLEQARERLVDLRRQIQDRNLINKKLASDILGYLNDAMALFVNPGVQPGYGTRGPARPSWRQPTLISREI